MHGNSRSDDPRPNRRGLFLWPRLGLQKAVRSMPSMIDPKKLTPNASNTVFEPLTPEVYAALKEDIAEHGIQTACMVTPDFTIIAGHHRVKAAIELGLSAVPVEIHDVSDEEAERLLIADNVLRRQITNPMEQARLIRRLKELHGIKQGKNSSSRKMREEAAAIGMSEDTAGRLDKLNDLIPALQSMVSAGELRTTHGASLATLTTEEQQALYDALGAERLSHLKGPDIQQAKKGPDTAALEAKITALQAERDQLTTQVQDAPDPTLLETLQDQLAATEEARQSYADELARLKAQGPVERIVEKIVEVEKPVPTADPAQAAAIAQLEADLTAAQHKVESLLQSGYAQADLARVEAEKKAAEKRLEDIRRAMAQAVAPDGKADQARIYRASVAKFVEEAHKRLKPILGDWQRVGAMEPLPANWMLYLDVQRLAESLETVATGLRRIPLDASASKKHGVSGQVIDVTATEKGETTDDADAYPRVAD